MMVRRIAVLLASLLTAAAAPAGSAAAVPADVTPALASRLDAALEAATGSVKGRTPALSVAVVEHGAIAYARAFGLRDVAAKLPATTDTRFRIGSVTKMFTAVAVMQLVEAGRVRLDAPLATYVPDAPHATEVTIRQLLNHTSGIWNYGDAAFASPRVADPVTPRDILAFVGARPLERAPGTTYAYSNTGYVLLGLVVEAVAKQPLAAYERAYIFAPAGMTQTTIGEAPAGAPVALGYDDATGTLAPRFSPTWAYADGDIVSTASDVARFDVALMNGRLVKPPAFALMQSSSVAADAYAPGARYGLGLTIVRSGGLTFVGHHGGVPGYEAENEIVPKERYAIVVLSDAFDFTTSVANRAVIRETLPDVARAAAAEAQAASQAARVEDPAITARMRAFITAVQAGTIDRATLAPEMSAALTPAAADGLRSQFAAYGALQSLAFRERAPVQGYLAYRYTAAFAGGSTVPLTLVLDKDGKIAGFLLQ